MIQPQNKLSALLTEPTFQLQQQEIKAFLAYHQFASAINKLSLTVYDYDVNLRQSRQYYITQRHHHSSRKLQQKTDQQINHSKVTENSNKKTGKPKVQVSKKADQMMINIPNKEIKSKLVSENVSNHLVKQDLTSQQIPFHLPMHSTFNDGYELNIIKQQTRVQNLAKPAEDDEMIQIPAQRKFGQSRQIVLPMIQKSAIKKNYYGQKPPEIVALNEFINKTTVFEIQPPSIHNNIDHRYISTSNKKIKLEKSRVSSPINKLAGQLKSRDEQFITIQKDKPLLKNSNTLIPLTGNKTRQTYSILVKTEQSYKQDQKSVSKSKSKSKNVKASTLFKRKQKIYQYSPCFKNIQTQPQKQQKSVSPELPHEPITHIYQAATKEPNKSKTKSISSNSQSKKTIPIPVEDYDGVFDQNSRGKYQREDKTSEAGDEITPYQDREKNSSVDEKQKASEGQDPLSYYAIPLHTIKKGNYEYKHEEILKQKQKDSQSQRSKDSGNQGEQKVVKIRRKKIFEPMQKQHIRIEQKDSTSTDLSEYTEEQMKMILGARGNKYKETIVKQYIRLQRQNRRNFNNL